VVGGPIITAATSVNNSGTISLASNAATGITVGGGHLAYAGLAAGNTPPSTTLTVNSLSSIDLSTATGSTNALDAIDGALATVANSSAALGAYQNRFSSTITTLQTNNVNTTAARSRITDADFATETANLSRAQVLQQAGTAMLAQANQSAQGVLSLLR
jgi:flagellin